MQNMSVGPKPNKQAKPTYKDDSEYIDYQPKEFTKL
jgi:hypothetical protein